MNTPIIPFLDLRRNFPERQEAEQVIAGVLECGAYILGPELEAFETEFAAALGACHAAGVGSGTDALILALEASGALVSGGEVITSAISAAFTAIAIYRSGGIPRFVDIDPISLQIDSRRLESAITERTRAILPVHLYGHCCDIDAIIRLADRYAIPVIEDACQAHGSRLSGRALGTFARAAAFSFYPTKNLGAYGDGGMVVSQDEGLIARVRMLRHGGQSRTYHHEMLGFCSRLDEIQSAILRMKLRRLEQGNDIRRKLALRYDEAFSDLDLARLPEVPGLVPNRHLYPIRTPLRDALRDFLNANGVQTLIHYPVPLPDQPAFRSFVLSSDEFPVARAAAREILSLPCYPELREDEHLHVIQAVRRFFGA